MNGCIAKYIIEMEDQLHQNVIAELSKTALNEHVIARIGLIADVQYADKDDSPYDGHVRQYRLSRTKLKTAISDFNNAALPLDCVLHLGDIIDGHFKDKEKTRSDFEDIMVEFDTLKASTLHTIGNHCLTHDRKELQKGLGLEKGYYRYDLPKHTNFSILVLDTCDVGLQGSSPELIDEAKKFLEENSDEPQAKPFNGGVGKEQLNWLKSELKLAETENRFVIVCGHMPIYAPYRLRARVFNHMEVCSVLEEFPTVVTSYFCGHYHVGGYRRKEKIHHVCIEGMVEVNRKFHGGHAVMSISKNGQNEFIFDIIGSGVTSRTLDFKENGSSKL